MINIIHTITTPEGVVEFSSCGMTREEGGQWQQKDNHWKASIDSLKHQLGVETLPETVKYSSFGDGGHHNVFYTAWGDTPPEGALLTFKGSKTKNKAWIAL